jgi:hypothetical protein
MKRDATFSDDRIYRYNLTREWDAKLPKVVFIGLNPSTADENKDDATIRKCIGFARRWNCGAIVMVNLFALVETFPAKMKLHPAPVGPANDACIRAAAHGAQIVVAAWGCDGDHLNRAADVVKMLSGKVQCLGLTKEGFPRHPSRRAYASALMGLEVTW